MNVFEAVKQSVTTRQAAEHYGIRVNRNGMACCPFHNDKTPSMKLDKRFHCFGCGADGDVIDFVAALYKEALNHTFDEPKQWEIREINEIMNQCITGWNYFSNPRMFAEYGRQKGWEREIPATDTDNPPEKSMDGFVEVTEQMELPF